MNKSEFLGLNLTDMTTDGHDYFDFDVDLNHNWNILDNHLKELNESCAGDKSLTTNQITNCITEIPQDIKLELNDGVLTLKAGSKVYVPNGFEDDGTTPKFDEVVIESDISATPGHSSTEAHFLYVRSNNSLFIEQVDQSFSGSTAPTGYTYAKWYDTANNLMKATSDGGSTWTSGHSLPLCIYHTENSVVKSIDQTFNGFGYIGSTVFVIKGVKGLSPNGRNDDGSLRSKEIATTNVATIQALANTSRVFGLSPNGKLYRNIDYILTDDNYNHINTIDGDVTEDIPVVLAEADSSGRIIKFNAKLPFRAVDYSDSSTVSGWGMPSNKYIDLTLGASGTTYTAPANGFVQLSASKATQVDLDNTSTGIRNGYGIQTENTYRFTFIPVKKGDEFCAWYTITTLDYFRFIYAEGEQ